ncbi:MAG TPA: macro domain-containing protein [Rhodanobacter sp.]|nr:macro domain-containing protein [Rhodanobacter sp.]
MIRYTAGNLLEAEAEALVNTVNTVGIMGKGIALMFRDAFGENFRAYSAACKQGEVRTGQMFVTERSAVLGPRWIINFPTKQDWRTKTRLLWVVDGLADLRRVIVDNNIRSIALPPLGCGNGGLNWAEVRPKIEEALGNLDGVDIQVYEPTREYQNVAKRHGVEKLTPARALIAELVRRYWVLGIECSLLEIQKLAWLLQRRVHALGLDDPLRLKFKAHKYGPYAQDLQHLLNSLDGSYLHCEKRLADAGPTDVIWFEEDRRPRMEAYLRSGEAQPYHEALEQTGALIDGFQSPLGMELLATVDWLLSEGGVDATVPAVRMGLAEWPAGKPAGQRKLALFDDRMIELALDRLAVHAHA